MKNLVLIFAFLFVVPMTANAQQPTAICKKAAWAEMNTFFAQYIIDFKKDAKKSLAPGEKLSADDLPTDLFMDGAQDDVFSFVWTERQECLCGVTVNTVKAANTCEAKVDYKSLECDCG